MKTFKRKGGWSDRFVSDNQSSSVTLNELAMKARKNTVISSSAMKSYIEKYSLHKRDDVEQSPSKKGKFTISKSSRLSFLKETSLIQLQFRWINLVDHYLEWISLTHQCILPCLKIMKHKRLFRQARYHNIGTVNPNDILEISFEGLCKLVPQE